jgi:Tol biopolymer transport system component
MQFTASVTCDVAGQCNTGVTWSVDAAAGGNAIDGTIAASGTYTAPTTVPSGGNVTVKAVGSDNYTSGAITVNVTQARVLVAYTNVIPGTCDYNEGCSNIYVFDLSSPAAGTQLLPQSSYQYYSPAISPDQSTIAYLASPIGDFSDLYELSAYTIPTAGGTPTPVSDWNSPYTVGGIDWKPDGSEFVINYWDQKNEVAGIATLSLDGKTITPIAVTDIACVVGICSPPGPPRYLADGRVIYSEQVGALGNSTYVVSADGTSQTEITNNGATVVDMGGGQYSYVFDTYLSPSPDGTKIVFQTNRDGIYDVYTENIDGTNRLPLAQTEAYQPTWCSGGKIVFVDGATGNLFSINSDGTDKTSLNIQGSVPYCR